MMHCTGGWFDCPPAGGSGGGGVGGCHLVAIFNDFSTAGYAGDSAWDRLQ